jgi:cyclopropane fatty-acyl-phospholipid synthase-like methyltransferase
MARSNLEYWKKLQAEGYFGMDYQRKYEEVVYKDRSDFGEFEVRAIEQFLALRSNMNVVVVGCGYGRESEYIAKRVKQVYGIDVSQKLLDKAVEYLEQRGVKNFTPVLAEKYETKIPAPLDLVFSIVVMQHLTRDLVVKYLKDLGRALAREGKMVIQFAEELGKDPNNDAELRVYEPMVNWTIPQLVALTRYTGLRLEEVRTTLITETALWHWAFISKLEKSECSTLMQSGIDWANPFSSCTQRYATEHSSPLKRVLRRLKRTLGV